MTITTPHTRAARHCGPILALAASLLALAAFGAAPAAAEAPAQLWTKCPSGSGAGQCSIPRGIAADPVTGHLFVVDQSNHRINELTAWGTFVKAFGWGVRDGSRDLQTCGPGASPPSASCQAGLAGTGAGQLGADGPTGTIAIDSSGDLYIGEARSCVGGIDCENIPRSTNRVQKFDQEGHFLRMWGGDVIVDGAAGSAVVSPGSASVTGVTTSEKAFEVGQKVEGTGIEPATTIAALGPGTITLSQPAGPAATGTSTALTAPAGPNNTPANEKQAVKLGANTTGGSFTLTFKTPYPSATSATATAIPWNATTTEVKEKLEALANIGAAGGEVAVTGAPGAWTVEFKGARYAGSDVEPMKANASGLTVSSGEGEATVTAANPEEICTVAAECRRGGDGSAPGQFEFAARLPLAVGPGDAIYVGGHGRIQEFDAEGHYVKNLPDPEGLLAGKTVQSLALDAEGDLWLAFEGKEDVLTMNKAGAVDCTARVERPSALAAVPGGGVYAVSAEKFGSPSIPLEIVRLDSDCEEVEELPAAEDGIDRSAGIATNTVDKKGGVDLYLTNAEQANSFVRAYGPAPANWLGDRPKIPPSIDATYATSVSSEGATVRAQINPHFFEDTRYYVQYGTAQCVEEEGWEGACVQATPAPPGALLSQEFLDEEVKTAATALEGLEPDTPYRYRFLAGSGGGALYGPERALHTFPLPAEPDTECPNQAYRAGLSARLPDCRAYELVSPLDKKGDVGAAVTGLRRELNASGSEKVTPVEQATPEGARITYVAISAFGDQQSAPFVFQYLAARGPGGWSSRSLNPQRSSTSFYWPVGTVYPRFMAFSPDLCQAWYLQDDDLPLAPGAQPGFPDLYQVDLCTEEGDDRWRTLTTVPPRNPVPNPTLEELFYTPTIQGASAVGETSLFSADGALTADANAALNPNSQGGSRPFNQLYAADGEGGVRLVSALPDGSGARNSSAGDGRLMLSNNNYDNVLGAVSGDGSRVYWTDSGEASKGGRIYLRLNPTQEQSAQEHGSAAGTGNLEAGSNKVSSLTAAKGTASFTKESPVVTELETEIGRFVAGQPVSAPAAELPAGATVLSCSPACGAAATALTLSKAAGKSAGSKTISSKGPMPFAVGQTIAAAGIPPETTITAAEAGKLTLSANVTQTTGGAQLSAYSNCAEAARACTIPVSGLVSNVGGATFEDAAADGSVAIFTVGESLYEFDASAAIAHQPEPASEIAGGLVEVMGASEDASRVYFASDQKLIADGEAGSENPEGDLAIAGKANLYLYTRGQGLAFVGTLSREDGPSSGGLFSPLSPRPLLRTSRVTPDGLHAAFSSSAALTGYDNAEVDSGAATSEVFLYDAAAGGSEAQLRCASCNPSGRRPQGRLLASVVSDGGPLEIWSAARIPGWISEHQPSRALSDDGRRLFFESYDALVARDTNGQRDVYQWEAPGEDPSEGACTEASPTYSPPNGGCLSLISSGKAAKGAEFIDASADGSDVFFYTAESLLPYDPGLNDLYDARSGGGFPEPPSPPAGCEGEACQSAPEAPNDPTPASAAFEGAGNVVEEAPKPKPCAKGKVRRKGRCVGKHKRHRKAQRHHRRADNDRRAR